MSPRVAALGTTASTSPAAAAAASQDPEEEMDDFIEYAPQLV